MIISIDHGNMSVKTQHCIIPSGLIESENKPGFAYDYVFWNGRYYMPTQKRIAYMRDKTEDDRYFALTLIAIAQELQHAGIGEVDDPIEITLLVGLPPAHYGQLHTRFEKYFLHNREIIDFEYNDCIYSIRINRVISYTQALAAAVTKFAVLKNHAVSYIIDIGGFTVDVLKLRYGRPDLEVIESFEKGVITLYNGIISKCNSQYARLLESCDIDEVISADTSMLPGEIQQLIRSKANQFLNEFFNSLRERGIDVATSKCVFAGGGSLLFQSMIERSEKVGFPIFINDIHANAIGYQILYRSEVAAHGTH